MTAVAVNKEIDAGRVVAVPELAPHEHAPLPADQCE
jgi:hypothetical protein